MRVQKMSAEELALRSFEFHGKPNAEILSGLQKKLNKFLSLYSAYLLAPCQLEIFSENNFPHSAGIASSASSMMALAQLLTVHFRLPHLTPEQQLSFIAREFSGSACRSLAYTCCLWGETPLLQGSSDDYAVPVTTVHSSFKKLLNHIFIIDDGVKSVSSSEGHERMNEHPYLEVRQKQARLRLSELLELLKKPLGYDFFELVEKEALELHAMMMTAPNPYVLLNPGSLQVMEEVTRLRREQHLLCGYTIDAGSTVHVFCDPSAASAVKGLKNNPFVQRVIEDSLCF
jgi:diphosphomevalonate decarboxylase